MLLLLEMFTHSKVYSTSMNFSLIEFSTFVCQFNVIFRFCAAYSVLQSLQYTENLNKNLRTKDPPRM